MPFVGAFHKGYAATHGGTHQDADRFTFAGKRFGCSQAGQYLLHIVTVFEVQYFPSEGYEFGFQVAQVHNHTGRAIDLLAVIIHCSDQVVYFMMGREHHRFPVLAFLQFAVGAVSGPLDAWLTTRGIKTLAVRMERHSRNAAAVAAFLSESDRVARVYYPGLAHHPGHAIAARQMSGFGGIVSVALESGEAARRFAESTRLFQLAESLGGVESLVNYPDAMTHASVRGTEAAVPVEVVRLSVGIEDEADLLEDLDRALRA